MHTKISGEKVIEKHWLRGLLCRFACKVMHTKIGDSHECHSHTKVSGVNIG